MIKLNGSRVLVILLQRVALFFGMEKIAQIKVAQMDFSPNESSPNTNKPVPDVLAPD